MNKGRLLRISLLLCIGLYGSGIAGSVKDRSWLKSKAGGDGALAFFWGSSGIYLVELSDGNRQKVGNGKLPEFSLDASILAWQDGSEIKGRLRKGDTNVRTLISGVHGKSGVHWISDKEFVCYKGGYLIVNAYTGETRQDSELNKLPGPPHDCREEEADLKRCDDGVWVVMRAAEIKLSNGESASRPGSCSGSLSPCGRSATGLNGSHDRCTLRAFRSGGPSGTVSRTVDCSSKGFDNHRWSSNNKNFIVAQWECKNKVGVWETGSSDVCILADCGGETYGDFTAGSPRVTSWGSGPEPEPEPEPDPSDNTKPSAPSNLSGSAAGRTQVDLSWDAAEDGESGIDKYLIYRDGQKIGESSSTSYSDKNCSAGTTYRYAVSAVNGEGMEGDKSNEKSVKTEDPAAEDPEPDPDPQPNPSGTVVSYDFTSMNSAPSNVEQNGGSWTSQGWRVDSDNEQLRIDLGQDLAKGTAEIVVTLNSNPTAPGGKINYFCVSELAENSHGSDGSKAYLRTGQAKYNFSKFKAYWKGFDHGEWERTVGSSGDWKTDGTTEHKISISWDENAKVLASTPPGEIGETLREFGPIRYVFLGSYNYGGVIPTMTFKSLVVTSEGAQPAPEDPAVDETAPEIVSATGNGTSVTVVFSEAVEKSSAEQTGNYSIDNNITVSNASLGSDNKTVTLTTSSLAEGTTYTVTVSNVKDRASTPNTIASGAQATFEVAAPGAGEVAYQYFEGSFSTLPDCDALTPKAEGTCTGFDIGKASRSENYCIRFIGKLRIDQEGEYTFATSSDDGSALYIGAAQVVDNDGVHGMEQKSGTINLTAGEHPIVVLYFQGGGGQNLEVSWKAPGAGSLQSIPAARLSVADVNDLTISGKFRLGTAENARTLSIGWTANRLTVSNLDPSHRYTLRLVDPSGRVLGTTVTKGSVNVAATVPAAARGVLLLQVHDGTKEMSRKILRR